MKVRCPVCRKIASWDGNPFRPFCSERCKLIDLGRWLDEDYRIPSESEIRIADAEGGKQEPQDQDTING